MKSFENLIASLKHAAETVGDEDVLVSRSDLSDAIEWLTYTERRTVSLIKRRRDSASELESVKRENAALKTLLKADGSEFPLWRRIGMQRLALKALNRDNVLLMARLDRIQNPPPFPLWKPPTPEEHGILRVITCTDDKSARYYCSCGFVGKASVQHPYYPTHALSTRLHRNHRNHRANAWVKGTS